MNAIPTILSDAFGRRRRWLAAPLLGLALLASQAAEAQIAFRNASSASKVAPNYRANNSATLVLPSAPTFQAVGTGVGGTAAITPAWPAHAIDDIALLFVESLGAEAVTLSTPAGFAAVANSPQATGTGLTGTRITVFWARATSTSMASPTVADPGDHVYARILTYRGVISNGNPWDITGGGVKAAASTTVTVTGVTTTGANTLVVQAVARDHQASSAAFSGQTNGNLTGIAERSDEGRTSPIGGGIGIWDGVKATAGATGNTTANITSSLINAFLTIALRPAPVITITKPSNTAQDDVMIASIGFRGAGPSANIGITPPTGWALANPNGRIDYPGGAGVKESGLVVYYKVAGAGEPANYSWRFYCAASCTTFPFEMAVGGITSFMGMDVSASPINIANGGTSPIGYSISTPSVITTVANAMLVTSHSVPQNDTWDSTPPSNMTQAFQRTSTTPEMIQVSYVKQAVAGATGVKTATDLGPDTADAGMSHILALKPLTLDLTINKPAGTVQNDVMVAAIATVEEDTVVTPPAGWTLVRRTENTAGSADLALIVYSKVAGASEPGSYTWGLSGSNYQHVAGGIQSFSGVDTSVSGGVNVESGQTTASSTSHATPDITPTVANTMLVTAHAYESSDTWTPPAGMTEAYDRASVATTPAAAGVAILGSYAPHVFLATGAKTATANGNADVGVTHILALRPLPVTGVAGGFNGYDTGTAGGATSGFVKTKVAGTSVSVSVIALNLPRTAIQTDFAGTVRVEVLNASDNSGALDANGCRSTWTTVLQTISPDPAFVAGDLGRKTVTFTQPESYKDLRLRVSFPTASPTRIGCSNDNFALRPNTLTSYSVTDSGFWETAGTTRALNNIATMPLGTTHKAGRPFTVRATAVNGAGSPATTTNYTGTATATLTDCGGSNPCTSTLGTVTLGSSFILGVLTANTATYDYAGSFNMQLVDSTFASVDAGDGSTTTERNITSSAISVGRFVPDHFTVALNTPEFGTACGAFNYIGQNFNYSTAPVITVTARNLAGGKINNYAGNLWQITAASLTGKSYTTATGTLNTGGITGTDPNIDSTTPGAGEGTLTFRSPSFFNATTGFFFTRTTPVAPFDADISLAINVIDADGVSYASNPARFGQATAGNGIAFSSSGKPMRFGRLVIRNANGSQLLPLQVRVEAQYWSGTPTNAFITNTLDNCTTIASLNNAMGPSYTGNLSSCETALSGGGALSMGRRTLQLSAPGAANNGSVPLTVNLGATASGNTCTTVGAGPGSATTAANLPHLQGNWSGANYDQNPTARATFGVSRGADEVIFVRENF